MLKAERGKLNGAMYSREGSTSGVKHSAFGVKHYICGYGKNQIRRNPANAAA